MSIILHDMNNLAVRTVFIKDVTMKDKTTKEVINIDWEYWKLIMFSSIYGSIFKIRDASSVVLAVDDRRSWRYDIWKRYKEDRKKKKKNDGFPWDTFFEKYNELLDELRDHMPFKVLRVKSAEADDIIGVIAQTITDPCEVISNDKDYLQLSSNRVKIYNPMTKKHVSHPNPEMFLIEQCLQGQAKDSIFNIKTSLDHPEGKRKPGFGPKAFEKVVVYGWKQWLKDNNLQERYIFNRRLMDFALIPNKIKETIMDDYEGYEYPHPDNIWKFIKKQEWPDFIDGFNMLEQKMLRLY